MNDAWRVASITDFQEVPVGDAISLLRVTAQSAVAAHPDAERPLLVVDEGDAASAYAALPAPADAEGTLRCAYSVPVEVLGVDNTFSLEFEDGLVIALPFPSAASASASASAAAPPTPADAPTVSPQVLGLLLDAAEARAELSATRELQALRGAGSGSLAGGPAPHGGGGEARAAELEIWSSELERRLAATTSELEQARAELSRLRGGAPLDGSDREQIIAAAVHQAGRGAERDLADAGA